MNDLTHPGLLSIWPVWGSPRRRCSQHLASFLSKTLFFPFLFSHRDRPAASYDFYIWRLFHHGFPEKLKTLLVIKGATCWSMPVSIYWERSWPLTLASVPAGDNSNSQHSQTAVDGEGFHCSHLISPPPPAQDRRPTAADEVTKSQRHQERLSVDKGVLGDGPEQLCSLSPEKFSCSGIPLQAGQEPGCPLHQPLSDISFTSTHQVLEFILGFFCVCVINSFLIYIITKSCFKCLK